MFTIFERKVSLLTPLSSLCVIVVLLGFSHFSPYIVETGRYMHGKHAEHMEQVLDSRTAALCGLCQKISDQLRPEES